MKKMDTGALFREADILEREYTQSFIQENTHWSGKRQALYFGGTFYGMYKEGNETLGSALKNL
ncbi:MAG: hypothetical protein K6G60_02820 [Lachnospiraceae bacterium]|nr:hypothetical protein [Lachnospiraceae bacterium]